jgi:hypothetical protein
MHMHNTVDTKCPPPARNLLQLQLLLRLDVHLQCAGAEHAGAPHADIASAAMLHVTCIWRSGLRSTHSVQCNAGQRGAGTLLCCHSRTDPPIPGTELTSMRNLTGGPWLAEHCSELHTLPPQLALKAHTKGAHHVCYNHKSNDTIELRMLQFTPLP